MRLFHDCYSRAPPGPGRHRRCLSPADVFSSVRANDSANTPLSGIHAYNGVLTLHGFTFDAVVIAAIRCRRQPSLLKQAPAAADTQLDTDLCRSPADTLRHRNPALGCRQIVGLPEPHNASIKQPRAENVAYVHTAEAPIAHTQCIQEGVRKSLPAPS